MSCYAGAIHTGHSLQVPILVLHDFLDRGTMPMLLEKKQMIAIQFSSCVTILIRSMATCRTADSLLAKDHRDQACVDGCLLSMLGP